jgi:C-terminal processing protease CtpA/Prc
MDEDWNDLLLKYIPELMEGSDLESFELTIMKLTAHLHDAHVTVTDEETINRMLGKYAVPADLIRADGKFVIKQVYGTDCPLQAGDVVLKQDDQLIEDVAAYFTQYFSVPNEEKLENKIFPFLLRSDNQMISLTVLRDGKDEIVHVKGVQNMMYSTKQQPLTSHEILEGNIGLINPSALKAGEIDTIMQEFRTTDGMIVDLRQYPSDINLQFTLAAYLKKTYSPFVTIAYPSESVPGIMCKQQNKSGMMMPGQEPYYYDKPVVILINETTQSYAEYTTMSLRTGENATVLGNNSIGADGNITYLPLLNGNELTFTSLGVYTPEMGQTQRIGLSPDIEVYPTVEGIKEGRDELKEAAIAYIQEQSGTKAK